MKQPRPVGPQRNGSDPMADERLQLHKALPLRLSHNRYRLPVAQIQWHRTSEASLRNAGVVQPHLELPMPTHGATVVSNVSDLQSNGDRRARG
jgi:hypothetical protein